MLFLLTRSQGSNTVSIHLVRNFPFPCITYYHTFWLSNDRMFVCQSNHLHLLDSIKQLLGCVAEVDTTWFETPSSVCEGFFQVEFLPAVGSLKVTHLESLPTGVVENTITCTQATLVKSIVTLLGLTEEQLTYETLYQYAKPWWTLGLFNANNKVLLTLSQNGFETELLSCSNDYKELPLGRIFSNRNKTELTSCCLLSDLKEQSLLLQSIFSNKSTFNYLPSKSHLFELELIKQRKYTAQKKELLLSQRKNDFYNYSN